jgi:uncharacterized protein YbaR (Trm112 family)
VALTRAARSAQSLEAKAAEVRFRRDLCRYRVGGEPLFEDEFDGPAMVPILRHRIADVIADVSMLPDVATLGNCLEVGAECCQRAAALTEHLHIPCWAADISLESLRAFDFYAERLGVRARPIRVCCDLARLPFRAKTFDLVMAYQTLHHFERPELIVAEIRRVNRRLFLGGDEPTCRVMRAWVGTRRHRIHSPVQEFKHPFRRFVEETLLRPCCHELDYGVTENENLSFAAWRRCFEPWYESHWYLGPSVARGERIDRRWNRPGLVAWLMGANVSVVARLKDADRSDGIVKHDYICPDCLDRGDYEHALCRDVNGLRCTQCRTVFPIVDHIPILLPTALRRALYTGGDNCQGGRMGGWS